MGHEGLMKVVEEVLEGDQQARDNDTWLIIQVLRKMGFKIFIDYSDLNKLPSFESITRCRRHVQNDKGKFLPSERATNTRTKADTEGLMANSQLEW